MSDAPFFYTEGVNVPEDVTRDVRHLVAGGSEGVVEAGNFRGHRKLERLRIREGTRVIGYGAFAYCVSLCEMNLPEGLRHIGEMAFFGHRFRQIAIPSSVVEIGSNAFAGYSSLLHPQDASVLSMVTLAGGAVLVCGHAFSECRQLQHITTLSKVIVVEDGVHGNGRAAVVTGGKITLNYENEREPTRLILASPYLASMHSEEDVTRVNDAINRIAGGRPPWEGPLDDLPRPGLDELMRMDEYERERWEDEWDRFRGNERNRIREGADRIRSRFLGLLSAHRRTVASIMERALFWDPEGDGVEPGLVEVILSFLGDVE